MPVSTKGRQCVRGRSSSRRSVSMRILAVPYGVFHKCKGVSPTKTQKRQSLPFYPLATQGFRNVWNAPRVVIPPPSKTPPVSACKPLCAILLRKPSVYPLSPVKANVGRLCERLKNAMKCGLEQRCAGNFLAIFAGTLLDEKPNFLSRIFGR